MVNSDHCDDLLWSTKFSDRLSERENFKYFGFGKRSLMVPNS